MTGTILNVAGIIAGGVLGWAKKKPLALSSQMFFRSGLGLCAVVFGLWLTWQSLNGTFLQLLKQLGIVLLAMVLGKFTGRRLRLQKGSNRLGRFARDKIAAAKPDNPHRFSDGFNICAILFCAAPLGILGAIADGLTGNGTAPGYFYPLAVKAVMDGLAAMSFVRMYGTGVVLSAAPVLMVQGTLTLLCARVLQPFLQEHHLVDPVLATAGLLIFCVALLIFEIKKIEVTDYLPSLFFAPLLAYWFH